MAVYNSAIKQRLPNVGVAYMNFNREYVSYYPKNKTFSLKEVGKKFYLQNFNADRMGKTNQCSIRIRLDTNDETADEIHKFTFMLNSSYRATGIWINGGYTDSMTYFIEQDSQGIYINTDTETRPWKITNFKIISNI